MKKLKIIKNRKLIIILLLISLLIIPVAYFGTNTYNQYLRNKTYKVGDEIKYPDFSLTVTKTKIEPAKIHAASARLELYGNIDGYEDCELFSNDKRVEDIPERNGAKYVYHSYRTLCELRNQSRQNIREYINKNRSLNINYKIVAKKLLTSSKIDIKILPDSGRDVDKNIESLKCNYFTNILDAESYVIDSIPSSQYVSIMAGANWCKDYNSYSKTSLGGDIGKGIERSGSIKFDINNKEKSVDFILSYKKESRTVRIYLDN